MLLKGETGEGRPTVGTLELVFSVASQESKFYRFPHPFWDEKETWSDLGIVQGKGDIIPDRKIEFVPVDVSK